MQLSRPEDISKVQVANIGLALRLFIFSPLFPLPSISKERIMTTHFVSIYDVNKPISNLKCFRHIELLGSTVIYACEALRRD